MKHILSALALGVLLSARLAAQGPAPVNSLPGTVAIATPNAEDTREALRQVLQIYPYTVGEILRRDPSRGPGPGHPPVEAAGARLITNGA